MSAVLNIGWFFGLYQRDARSGVDLWCPVALPFGLLGAVLTLIFARGWKSRWVAVAYLCTVALVPARAVWGAGPIMLRDFQAASRTSMLMVLLIVGGLCCLGLLDCVLRRPGSGKPRVRSILILSALLASVLCAFLWIRSARGPAWITGGSPARMMAVSRLTLIDSVLAVLIFAPAAMLVALPVAWLFDVPIWRRAQRPAGLCGRCGYNLTGNVSGVCPECGTPV